MSFINLDGDIQKLFGRDAGILICDFAYSKNKQRVLQLIQSSDSIDELKLVCQSLGYKKRILKECPTKEDVGDIYLFLLESTNHNKKVFFNHFYKYLCHIYFDKVFDKTLKLMAEHGVEENLLAFLLDKDFLNQEIDAEHIILKPVYESF